MDIRILEKLRVGMSKPFPDMQCYLTIRGLADRYEVSTRTIRRWADDLYVLPLDIDSELGIRRWDIEELLEFEDDVRIAFEGIIKED